MVGLYAEPGMPPYLTESLDNFIFTYMAQRMNLCGQIRRHSGSTVRVPYRQILSSCNFAPFSIHDHISSLDASFCIFLMSEIDCPSFSNCLHFAVSTHSSFAACLAATSANAFPLASLVVSLECAFIFRTVTSFGS